MEIEARQSKWASSKLLFAKVSTGEFTSAKMRNPIRTHCERDALPTELYPHRRGRQQLVAVPGTHLVRIGRGRLTSYLQGLTPEPRRRQRQLRKLRRVPVLLQADRRLLCARQKRRQADLRRRPLRRWNRLARVELMEVLGGRPKAAQPRAATPCPRRASPGRPRKAPRRAARPFSALPSQRRALGRAARLCS